MYMQDENILEEIIETRNLNTSSIQLYQRVMTLYSQQNNTPIKTLLEEAEEEEEKMIRWKKRKLRTRLMKFRSCLYKRYLQPTAKRYFTCICTIYRDYDIEIQKLPPISKVNINSSKPINYTDLPDEEIIKKALNISNTKTRALILFLCSSGCGRAETCNLKIQDYINATKRYHNADNIFDVLNELKDKKDIIPQFEIYRQKTGKHYITFCTPEAAYAINLFLTEKTSELGNQDRLFSISPQYLGDTFRALNNKLCLGKMGSYIRFRPHMLRKFHASHLHNDGLGIDVIDSLQGRSKNSVHKVYFMDDPETLRELYVSHMDAVMIEWNYNNLTYKSDAYLELERENFRKSLELDSLSDRLSSIESFIFKDMSDNKIKELERWL